MNIRKISISLATLTILTFYGCTAKQDSSSAETTASTTTSQDNSNNDDNSSIENTTVNDNNASKNITNNNDSKENTTSNQSSSTTSKENNNILYGKWNISKLLAHGNISANSQADIDNIVGKTMEFSQSKIIYNGKSYTNPQYTNENISSTEFLQDYRMELSKLNISGNTVVEVSIDNYDGINSEDMGIGTTYFIKDNNTVVLYSNGDYFELNRVS